jgi:hypothetical protein
MRQRKRKPILNRTRIIVLVVGIALIAIASLAAPPILVVNNRVYFTRSILRGILKGGNYIGEIPTPSGLYWDYSDPRISCPQLFPRDPTRYRLKPNGSAERLMRDGRNYDCWIWVPVSRKDAKAIIPSQIVPMVGNIPADPNFYRNLPTPPGASFRGHKSPYQGPVPRIN